jgi:ABC-2 type transport system permease protein/lipopolysaccharide transport system permease protein
VDVTSTIIAFTHQLLIIVAVFLIYRVPLHWSALMSLPGLFVLIINGIWVTQLFGILGVRYRDLSEIFQAVMRIAFLATPIVWMPSPSGRGNIMTKIMAFNPFYHFLEIVRAPLLGQAVSPLSWAVVISFTVVGLVTAHVFSTRYGRLVPLWV